MNRGFSLIQLSLILVGVALIAGGVLFGKSLLRTMELRSVASDFRRYTIAVDDFRQQYKALPGDMANAEAIWGTADARDCLYTQSADSKTCNGNGNGRIDASDHSSEYFRFWQHLSNAGMIGGEYTGAPLRMGIPFALEPGRNVPKGRVDNASWFALDRGRVSNDRYLFNGNYGNSLVVGLSSGNGLPITPIFTGKEAASLDTKLDDGNPGTGHIVPTARAACTQSPEGKPLMLDTADASRTDAKYTVEYERITCALYFRRAF